MIIIWRPFKSIKKSIKTLDEGLLYKFGRLEIAAVLLEFARRKQLTTQQSSPICRGEFVEWYWNDGKPFIRDLLEYYKYAGKEWIQQGGEKTVLIPKDLLKQLKSLPQLKAPWTGKMARYHRYTMLNLDWFWYKRFFREENEWERKLNYIRYFTSHKPNGISETKASHLSARS